jgi:glycosyltransferase involved in cell wall biosynthesis
MPIAQFQMGHGGAEVQAHRLARALIADGHTVELVTARQRGESPLELVEGVPVRRLFAFGNRPLVWRLGSYSYVGLLVRELLRRKDEHDVVHVHQAFHAAFGAVLARRLGGRPVIVKVATAGRFGDLEQMRAGRPTLPAGSSRMLDQVLAQADALVAISDAIADELVAAGAPPDRVIRIPNGVEMGPLPTVQERAEARATLSIDPLVPVAVYVGRSGAQKGSDILLAAWRMLFSSRAPAAHLFVLGEGLQTDAAFMAEAGAFGPVVTVAGRVRDVRRYLLAADLFVLPSRGEGMSNAILEAMAAGVPCLVSDIPANRELVTAGQTGLTFPSEDAAALAAAITNALSNRSGLSLLAAAARANVETHYSMSSVARRYQELYARLQSDTAAARSHT